jgi:predicted secreted protein
MVRAAEDMNAATTGSDKKSTIKPETTVRNAIQNYQEEIIKQIPSRTRAQ